MKKKQPKNQVLTAKVGLDMKRKVLRIAKRTKKSKSYIINMALENYFAK